MKNTGINPVVIKEIRQMAQQCGLVRVILFGSRARGDFTNTKNRTTMLCLRGWLHCTKFVLNNHGKQ